MMSPMPLYFEKITGRERERQMIGKMTVATYRNADTWRFTQKQQFHE